MASRSSPKKDDVEALLEHTNTGGSHMESSGGGGGSAVGGGGMSNYVSFDGVSKKTDAFNDAGRDLEAGIGSKGSGTNGTAENNGYYMTGGKRPLREQFMAFKTLASPYFRESKDGRFTFYILVLLTLMNSGVRGEATPVSAYTYVV